MKICNNFSLKVYYFLTRVNRTGFLTLTFHPILFYIYPDFYINQTPTDLKLTHFWVINRLTEWAGEGEHRPISNNRSSKIIHLMMNHIG